MQVSQAPFDADVTYEAATVEVVVDDDERLLGIGVRTTNGMTVLVGINGVEMTVLARQTRDAIQDLQDIRVWQAFCPD